MTLLGVLVVIGGFAGAVFWLWYGSGPGVVQERLDRYCK